MALNQSIQIIKTLKSNAYEEQCGLFNAPQYRQTVVSTFYKRK